MTFLHFNLEPLDILEALKSYFHLVFSDKQLEEYLEIIMILCIFSSQSSINLFEFY